MRSRACVPVVAVRSRALLACLVLGLLILAGGLPARAQQDVPGPMNAPILTAEAGILVDAASGAILYEKNADQRRAPASLTKIVTALTAVRHAPLDSTVTATDNSLTEPVVIGLTPGDTLSLRDALYGLLLPSGNDVALAIAESVGGGSIERFVGWMNEEAARLGLSNTHFANPEGFDGPDHYSTARDLAQASRALLAHPELATIVTTAHYVVEGETKQWEFYNSNPLLGQYEGVDGIKTGLTDNAGRCLALSATLGGHRVVAVILHSESIADDGRLLLDYAVANFTWVPVVGSDGRLETRPVPQYEVPFLANSLRVAAEEREAGGAPALARLTPAELLGRLATLPPLPSSP